MCFWMGLSICGYVENAGRGPFYVGYIYEVTNHSIIIGGRSTLDIGLRDPKSELIMYYHIWIGYYCPTLHAGALVEGEYHNNTHMSVF